MKKLIGGIIVFSFLILPVCSEARSQISVKNKFGVGGSNMDKETNQLLKYTGAGWVRPHIGPAVWGDMQSKKNSSYDWDEMDELVEWYQDRGYNLLITIWPFATWDQKNRDNAADCKVSSKDIFAGELSLYRCNPNNWKKYRTWVKAMVERYDGDGKDDMDGLLYGIKYWEVMNEPDLTMELEESGAQKDGGDEEEEDDSTNNLDFYAQSSEAYFKLLKKTSTAIKASDPKAKVVIAGAAGGHDTYMDFWDDLFDAHPKAKQYFDIGNVHCVNGGDYYKNYNVKVYNRMLRRHNMNKNIWVTEADSMIHDTKEENYTETRASTRRAFNSGATKIFNVMASFGGEGKNTTYAKKKFKIIVDKFN